MGSCCFEWNIKINSSFKIANDPFVQIRRQGDVMQIKQADTIYFFIFTNFTIVKFNSWHLLKMFSCRSKIKDYTCSSSQKDSKHENGKSVVFATKFIMSLIFTSHPNLRTKS